MCMYETEIFSKRMLSIHHIFREIFLKIGKTHYFSVYLVKNSERYSTNTVPSNLPPEADLEALKHLRRNAKDKSLLVFI